MLQVDIDHEMLNSFFGDQRPGYSGLSSEPAYEEGFPFDKEDPSLRQMFLPDTPLKGKKSVKAKKPVSKPAKRKRQYSSSKKAFEQSQSLPFVKPTWKKPQCLKLMVDITKLEPLSSKERTETESNYSEEDFNELMCMVLDEPTISPSTSSSKTKAKPKPKSKPKRSPSSSKRASPPKASAAAKPKPKPKQKTKQKPKPKPKPTAKLKLPSKPKPKPSSKQKLKPKPKVSSRKKPTGVVSKWKPDQSKAAKATPTVALKAKLKLKLKPKPKPSVKSKANAKPVVKAKGKGVKRILSKAGEEKEKKRVKKADTVRLGLRKGNGLPSPDSSATTFDFILDDYDFSLDVMDTGDAANKRRRTKWHDEDTRTLWEGILRYGNNWSEIKSMLPGRTYYQVKDKGRRLLHHKGWKTGRSKNDACGAGEYAKNIAKNMLASIGNSSQSGMELSGMAVNHDLVSLKLPSVAANA